MIPHDPTPHQHEPEGPDETPLMRVLAQLSYTSYSRGYLARCPAHGDRDPSLIVWDDPTDGHVGLKCFAGCTRKAIVEAIGLTETDLYQRNRPRALRPVHPGVSLMDLAVGKLIHPHFLEQWGLTDITYKGRPAVRIPYFQADGTQAERARIRTALTAKKGSEWSAGKSSPIPYGLHRLGEARTAGYLVIVEGESDCWTLWQGQFPALGLPGATQYQALELAMLADIPKVYVMQEPGVAGSTLPVHVKKRLRYLGYTGNVYALNLHQYAGAKDPNDLLTCDFAGFRATFTRALQQAEAHLVTGEEIPDRERAERPHTFTLASLMGKEFPPVTWAIPGLLPEGLTLLCGKPKLGKSWLVLGFALGIACGGAVLGKITVEQGQVLYLALEDTERRLQRRAKQVLQEMGAAPDALHLAIDWPRMGSGGLEALDTWIAEHPRTRLVIVDTWTKLAPRAGRTSRTQYEEEYDALTPLKALADKHTLAILAVTHLRKMQADDVLDEISGTTGFTGAVDGLLVLKRERGQQAATLHVVGRDIEEEQALALMFDQVSATWSLEGKVGEAQMKQQSRERQALLDLLREYPSGLTAQEVAELSGKNPYTVRNLLRRMVQEKTVTCRRGIYSSDDEDDRPPKEPRTSPKNHTNHEENHGRGSSSEPPVEPVNEEKNHGNHANQPTHLPNVRSTNACSDENGGDLRGSRGSFGGGDTENAPVKRIEDIEKLNHSPEKDRGTPWFFGDLRGSFAPDQSQESQLRPPETEEDEGMRLVEAVRQREAECTHLFWNIPGSGFDTAYLRREVYLQRLEACLRSGDEVRRAAVIAEMKASLR